MRLGVPFIAPRQLGAVESISGRQFLPSVDWRIGQSGAPPDTVRCTTGHCPVRISFLFWRSRPLAIWSRWRTGHCPVPPSDRWPGHASRADCAADRWLGRPLAHRTVRCANFSRTPLKNSRERPFHESQPGAPDTVRCTTGLSGAPRLGLGTFKPKPNYRTEFLKTDPKFRFFGVRFRFRFQFLRTSVLGVGLGFECTPNRNTIYETELPLILC
jgi:hypothetical protein